MSHYPPIPQRKSCNCEDPCISTDDVYYAGPNLPYSGINTYNVLTEVIEKLDAIYSFSTLQKVTEEGNLTTLPIIADSFVKIGGDGTNILLDDGDVLPIGDLPSPTLPYKVYTALLTQVGSDPITDAPTAIVLENTIGNISFTYESAGLYFMKSSGLFLNDKTWYSILANWNGGSAHINNLTYIDDSTILIEMTNGIDNHLIKTPIEIRVYN